MTVPIAHDEPVTLNDEALRPVTGSSTLTANGSTLRLVGVAGGVIANTGFLRSMLRVDEVATWLGPVVAPNTASAARFSKTVPSLQFETATV